MLERYNAAIGFMMLALGSVATSRAASAQNASNDNFGAFAAMNGAAGSPTRIFQQRQNYARLAPIGDRQPRQSDIPVNPELSPLERELQQEGASVDKKIVICRHC
jgi:hypothetical protein